MPTTFERPIYDTTELDARLVSLLTGVPVARLREWHEQGIAPATLTDPTGMRDDPPGYSWRDYHRARVAAGLAERGVKPECLGEVMAALERGANCCPEKKKRPPPREFEKRDHPVVFYDDDPLPEFSEATFASQMHGHRIGCTEPDSVISVLREMDEAGPLGRMSIFREWLDLKRGVKAGRPILKGHGIRTETIMEYAHGDDDAAAEIADALEVDVRKVRAALIFERELARIPQR